jgi:hypothetical protein
MAIDLSLELRKAVVGHLLADAALTALVPAARIYGEQAPATPAWPFIRYGLPITAGYEATCWDGSTGTVTIHAFAEGPGMDKAARIAARIVASMAALAPAALGITDNEWIGTNIVRDSAEADKYHAIIQFSITAIS